MNTEPLRPPSGVSRLRTSAERPEEVSAEPSTPNKASAAELLRPLSEPQRLPSVATRTPSVATRTLSEPQRLPSDATRTSAELRGRPKKASAASEASAAKPLTLRPLRPLNEASAEPLSEASTERLLRRQREGTPSEAIAEPLRPSSEPLRLPSDATRNMPWPLSIEPSEPSAE